MAAVALDLFDRRRQHLLAQLFAQLGDDVLADVVGADVEQIELASASRHRPANSATTPWVRPLSGMQGIVDGRQQYRDAQAADHAQENGCGDDESKGFEQGKQFADGASGRLGHGRQFLGSEGRYPVERLVEGLI